MDNGSEIKVTLDGKIEDGCGTIVITNGKVSSVNIKNKKYKATYSNNKITISDSDGEECDLNDENKCSFDMLAVGTVTEEDGLYKDSIEDGRCVYKGAIPNNYISFNNELWRIVSIENDGTLKIVRDKFINNREMAWDSDDTKSWENATLNKYLNGTYYNSLIDTKNIVPHTWNIGGIAYDSTNNQTLKTDLQQEKSITWTGKIGLISVTDYVRSNTNTQLCGTVSKNYTEVYNSICKNTTWLFKKDIYWTITHDASDTLYVWMVHYNGNLYLDNAWFSDRAYVYPALYLNSNVKIASGSGTLNDPYILSN